MHVRAEPVAQRRVEQVRRGVVARGRVARHLVDARDDALADVQLALDRLDDDAWSSPARTTSATTTRQSPSSHSIAPASEIWPPPAA